MWVFFFTLLPDLVQVRTVVGEMSTVDLRGLGSCRVHVFLYVADATAPDLYSAERARPAVEAAATETTCFSSAEVSDANIIRNLP